MGSADSISLTGFSIVEIWVLMTNAAQITLRQHFTSLPVGSVVAAIEDSKVCIVFTGLLLLETWDKLTFA